MTEAVSSIDRQGTSVVRCQIAESDPATLVRAERARSAATISHSTTAPDRAAGEPRDRTPRHVAAPIRHRRP